MAEGGLLGRRGLGGSNRIRKNKFIAGDEPTILIIGAGCVGTYLATKCSKAGYLTFLKGRDTGEEKTSSRSSHQNRVATLCKEAGVQQISSFKELSVLEFDFVFLTTKTYDYCAVAEEISAHKVSGRVMVAIHNGITIYPFDHKPVVQVVIPQSYDIVSDARSPCGCQIVVRNEEKPWSLPNIPAARKAVAILTQAGLHAEASPSFEVLLIRKYVINGVANLLSIVADTNCDGLCRDHWDRMQDLYKEFMHVLEHTFPNGFKDLPENFHSVVFNGLASYGQHFPSSKHDFDAGKPVEVGSLNGFVLHCGQKLGMPLPHNEKLVAEVNEMIQKRDALLKNPKPDRSACSIM